MAITTWAATTGDWNDSKFSRPWDGPNIESGNADLTLSSSAPSSALGYNIIPESANLELIESYEWDQLSMTWSGSTGLGAWDTGISPQVAIGTYISPDNADITLTGLAPAQGIIYTFPVDEADLTLSGSVPSAVEDSIGAIPKGDLTLSSSVPIATENQQENVSNADLTLSSSAPSRTLQRKIYPEKADLAVTGQVPPWGQSHFRTVDAASLTGFSGSAGSWDESTYTWTTVTNNWNTGEIAPEFGVTYTFTIDSAGNLVFTPYAPPWPYIGQPKYIPEVIII
tara:strand:- start:296 stop:1144 length:849 start_codon:yes stop_codon:yes gene_type:complete